MTREDTILTQLMTINGSLGRLESGLVDVKDGQKEMRKEISDLYDLHRNCEGPKLAGEVATLRADLNAVSQRKIRSDSQIPRPVVSKLFGIDTSSILFRVVLIVASAVLTALGFEVVG